MRRQWLAQRAVSDEFGGVAVTAALMMPVLIGGMALGAESGYWYLKQRKLQHAADMAAYAAAIRLMQGDTSTQAEAAGQRVGRCTWDNDPTCATTPVTVSIEITTPHNGHVKTVRALATESLPRYLTAVFTSSMVNLSADAVARYTSESAAKACVLALDRSADVGVKVSGKTSVTFNGCDVVSNSGSDASFMMESGAAVITTRCIQLSGEAKTNEAADINLECDEIREYKPALQDPFKNITEPSTNIACYEGKTNEYSVGPKEKKEFLDSEMVAHPSGLKAIKFCGGLRIQGTAIFAPGIYLVPYGMTVNSGASLRVVTNSANDANADGKPDNGLMFYLYDGAGVTMNGQADLDLMAITDEQHPLTADRPYTYAGMLFFSARDNTSTVNINGGSGSVMTGTVYAPDAQVQYAGNAASGSSGCMRIVGATVVFTGTSGVSADCSGMDGTPIYSEPSAALIE